MKRRSLETGEHMKALEQRDERLQASANEVMTGYWLQRSDCPGKVFAGTSLDEVLNSIRAELENDFSEGLSPDELSVISLHPIEITQREIDILPEFGGW